MEDEEVKNEEGNDSEKKNAVTTEDEKTKEEVIPPVDDKTDNSYRPSEEKKEAVKIKDSGETVPLKKYLDLKRELKELSSNGSQELTNQTLEDFATEAGLTVEVVTKLASMITKQATEEATRIADERVKPIVLEKINKSNLEAFEADFQKSIAAKYPELASKMEVFKKVAFSKDFLHLTNLEAIKNEFFPDAKPLQKEVKKGSIEGGSQGGGKESEMVDFSKLKSNEDLYEKVMKDPVARAKYYEWQDSQSSI